MSKNGGEECMNDNREKAQANFDRQRLVNRALLLTVSVLDEKGLRFGRNRIGSVLKGHKHKYILDNKLDSTDIYGLLKGIDFREILTNMDKLIQYGYLVEKHPDQIDSKYSDDSGNAVYLTDKGSEKLKSFSGEELVGVNSGYSAAVKPKPDCSIPEIVNVLINESGSYKGIISSERKYRVMRAYFGWFNTLEEVGKLFGVTRERIRQIIRKEISRLNRFPKVKDELSRMNAFITDHPGIDVVAVLKQVYDRDCYGSDELRVYARILNYMLKEKGYCTFQI